MEQNQKISLVNRKTLEVTLVETVNSATENKIICKTSLGELEILGSNLHVDKLDLNEKILIVIGDINSTKYGSTKKPFLKRIFK